MQLLTKPSYRLGLAPRNGAPLYPSLRRGLVTAWASCLGPTGLSIRDVVRGVHLDSWSGMDAASDWVMSEGQYAVDLDGINDYIQSTIDLPTPTFPLSLSGWFYPRGTPTHIKSIFRTNTSTTTPGAWLVIRADSTVGAGFGRPFGTGFEDTAYAHIANTATTVPNDTWCHVAAVIRGANNIDLWVNGIKTSVSYTGSATTIAVSATQPVSIGRVYASGGYRYGSSLYDDMLYYNRPLSDGEIILLSSGRGVAHSLSNDRLAVGIIVPDTTAPTLSTPVLSGATSLVLPFDEAVTLTDATGMTIAASGGAVTISSIAGDGTDTLTATLSRSIASTESLSFSFDSGTGNVEDLEGNALETITGRLVTNNVSATPGSVSLIGPGLIQ